MTPLSIHGTLLKKGDVEYEAARSCNFAQNSHRRGVAPAIIAIVENIQDVQACIKYASEKKMTVSVRTGGHNWFGCFLRDEGLLIDMSRFNSLEVDPSAATATLGPAVVGTELNAEASMHGLCFSSGHCVGVPLGGFLLGGGYGWFVPYYGLAAEHILAATIVTPEGEVITASTNEYKDWMYLVRGSASAFPGVVVSFTLRLSPVAPIIRAKSDFYPIDEYVNIVKAHDKHVVENPDLVGKCEITVGMACTPPPLAEVIPTPKVVMVIYTFMADSEEEIKKCTDPLTSLAGLGEPYMRGPFEDKTFVGLSEMLAPAFPPGQHWIVRCPMFEPSAMSSISWDAVRAAFVDKAPMGLSHTMMVWSPKKATTVEGAYGKLSGCGFMMLVIGVHGADEDAAPAKSFVEASMDVLDQHSWKYNPLETPLNKETFGKSFVDETHKVLQLRGKLDPHKLFFDPSTARPSH